MATDPPKTPKGSEPEVDLSPEARDLLRSVQADFENGGLSASQKQRMAILGRVLTVGEDESSTNSLSDSLETNGNKSKVSGE